MGGDRERWDAKYRGSEGEKRLAPDPFFLRALESLGGLAGARAVDLACGTGRHALELARRGAAVEAWDVSPIALEILGRRASEHGLAVTTRALDLSPPAALPGAPFDLAVAVDFLERALWARLGDLVRPGGHALLTTFTHDWPGAKPPLQYRLAPGELAHGIPGFETLFAEESGGRAGWFGRRLDVRE